MTEQPQQPVPTAGPGLYQYPPYQYPQGPDGTQVPPPGYGEPTAPDGRPLAGPGQRLGARVIDSIIWIIGATGLSLLVAVGLVPALQSFVADNSPVIPITAISTIFLIMIGGQYLYEVEIPLRWNGQTPGKRMVKIAITAMEPGLELSRGKLAYRWVVMLGFNLLSNCYIGLLDPLWCLWDKPYRQCLHDKPAKTTVIRVVPA